MSKYSISENGFLYRINVEVTKETWFSKKTKWMGIDTDPHYRLFRCYHETLESAQAEIKKIEKFADNCWRFHHV